jgi:hypothetical protein
MVTSQGAPPPPIGRESGGNRYTTGVTVRYCGVAVVLQWAEEEGGKVIEENMS